MAEIVRFEINIPQLLKLKQARGLEKEGNYGTQFMHSLIPSGIVFLDPQVEQMVQELGVRDGESVEVIRPAKGKAWIVRRPEQRTPTAAAVTTPATTPTSNRRDQQNVATSSQDTPQSSRAAKLMAGALIASIDAMLIARQYAISKGLEVTVNIDFNAEDLRCLAATTLIQYFKVQPMQDSAAKYDGGAQWQQ
jgi:hypothetical protein